VSLPDPRVEIDGLGVGQVLGDTHLFEAVAPGAYQALTQAGSCPETARNCSATEDCPPACASAVHEVTVPCGIGYHEAAVRVHGTARRATRQQEAPPHEVTAAPQLPPPEWEPEPPASEPLTGTVRVEGSAKVRLSGPDGNHGPGSVPTGRYDVQADFGGGYRSVGVLEVKPWGSHLVKCSKMMLTCTVR